MKARAMQNAAASCYKEKWMDDAYPNPHQIDMCKTRTENKQMGEFWRTLENERESNYFKYTDCLRAAGNSASDNVICIRNYLTGLD